MNLAKEDVMCQHHVALQTSHDVPGLKPMSPRCPQVTRLCADMLGVLSCTRLEAISSRFFKARIPTLPHQSLPTAAM